MIYFNFNFNLLAIDCAYVYRPTVCSTGAVFIGILLSKSGLNWHALQSMRSEQDRTTPSGGPQLFTSENFRSHRYTVWWCAVVIINIGCILRGERWAVTATRSISVGLGRKLLRRPEVAVAIIHALGISSINRVTSRWSSRVRAPPTGDRRCRSEYRVILSFPSLSSARVSRS